MITVNSVVKVSTFYKKDGSVSFDRNNKEAVIFTPFAGSIPSTARVITGTVAERMGVENGKNYLINVQEVESNEYGRQFRHQCLGGISALELAINDFSALGEAKIIDTSESIPSMEPEKQNFNFVNVDEDGDGNDNGLL